VANVFAIELKADTGGTISILCQQLVTDPLFPEKVVMVGILGVSLPISERWMHVQQWSVHKSLVQSWKVGPLRMTPELDFEGLVNREKVIPVLAGTEPSQVLLSHPEEVLAMTEAEDAAETGAKKTTAAKRAPK